MSNNSIGIQFNDDLKFTSRYSLDYNLTNSHRYQNPTHGGGVSDNGYAYQSSGRSFTWAFANQLKWDKTFNDVHYVSALAQMSFQKQKYDFLSSKRHTV